MTKVATMNLTIGQALAEGGVIVGFGDTVTNKRGTYRRVFVTLGTGSGLIHTRNYNIAGSVPVK